MLAGCGRQPLSIGASSIRFFKIDPEDDDPIGLPCREVYTTSNVAFILVLIGEGEWEGGSAWPEVLYLVFHRVASAGAFWRNCE